MNRGSPLELELLFSGQMGGLVFHEIFRLLVEPLVCSLWMETIQFGPKRTSIQAKISILFVFVCSVSSPNRHGSAANAMERAGNNSGCAIFYMRGPRGQRPLTAQGLPAETKALLGVHMMGENYGTNDRSMGGNRGTNGEGME